MANYLNPMSRWQGFMDGPEGQSMKMENYLKALSIDELERQRRAREELLSGAYDAAPAGLDSNTGITWDQARPENMQAKRNLLNQIDPQAGVDRIRQQMYPAPVTPIKLGQNERLIDPNTRQTVVDAMAPEFKPQNMQMPGTDRVVLARTQADYDNLANQGYVPTTGAVPGARQVAEKEPDFKNIYDRATGKLVGTLNTRDPETQRKLASKEWTFAEVRQDKPTESENQAAYLARGIADSLGFIQTALQEDPEAITSAWLDYTPSMVSDQFASENAQIVRNNLDPAIDNVITLGTGAAYTADQLKAKRSELLPRSTESEKVRNTKLAKWNSVYNAAREKARTAGVTLPPSDAFNNILLGKKTPAPQQPQKPRDPLEGKTASNARGQRIKRVNGQWVPM